eukprot:g2232.t1
MVKKVGKYEIGKTLGEGTFGKVKFATNVETNEQVAIKVLDKEKIQKQNMGAQIKKEISIMKMVKHPFVVGLKEVLASRTKIFIVLELITGGELFDKIVSEGRFNDEAAKFYLDQLVDGVMYCHNQGVCHRDLKPENLLLDENGDLKISDFGLSALYNGPADEAPSAGAGKGALLHTTCGTPNYVAPEVLADKGYDGRAADVWSIGVILYVLLAGFLPFDEPTMSALFRKIQKAEYSYPSWFSKEAKDLLDKILVPDPTKRVTLDEILKDPWWGDFRKDAAAAGGKAADAAESVAAIEPQDFDDVGADDDDGKDDGEDEGPKSINAFDIINMCGGMALNRMFTIDDSATKKVHQAISTNGPVETIAALVKGVTDLAAGDETLNLEGTEQFDKSNKVKVTFMTRRGICSFTAQVYLMAKGLNLLEIRKGRGDMMAYTELIARITDDAVMGPVVNAA